MSVAQLVERRTVAPVVEGSSPSTHPNSIAFHENIDWVLTPPVELEDDAPVPGAVRPKGKSGENPARPRHCNCVGRNERPLFRLAGMGRRSFRESMSQETCQEPPEGCGFEGSAAEHVRGLHFIGATCLSLTSSLGSLLLKIPLAVECAGRRCDSATAPSRQAGMSDGRGLHRATVPAGRHGKAQARKSSSLSFRRKSGDRLDGIAFPPSEGERRTNMPACLKTSTAVSFLLCVCIGAMPLPSATSSTLSGTVTDAAGGRISRATVNLFTSTALARSTESAADGTFSFTNLVP